MKIKSIGSNQTELTKGDVKVLFSYETPVALFIESRGYFRTKEKHSVTTSKHLNKWCPPNATLVAQSEIDNWEKIVEEQSRLRDVDDVAETELYFMDL